MDKKDCITKAEFLKAYDNAADKMTTRLVKTGASYSQVTAIATYVSLIIAIMEVELFGVGDADGN